MEKNKEDELSSQKMFEPLPFFDTKLFDETFDIKDMKMNINLFTQNKLAFIPNKPIRIQITAEKQSLSHMIHPYIYSININHYLYSWQVNRSLKEIRDVHKALLRLAKSHLGIHDIPKEKIKSEWPLFPTNHDALIPENKIYSFCRSLAVYLERLLTYPPYRDHHLVQCLLSVSPVSFTLNLGQSLIEDMLYKKSGDILLYGNCIKSRLCCQKLKVWYERRWFCLKDTYILYLNPYINNSISFVMLIDSDFECKLKIKAGAYYAIQVKNLERRLTLKCKNSQQQKEWYEKILYMINTTGKFFTDPSLLRYESFAPNRLNQFCKWYVNSCLYMEHVMNALNNAKEEIYIADWWLCPELYLKRPTDDLEYRLDKILLKKAKEGIKIYVLLYREITIALNLMSLRTRHILTENGSNPNIKVLRHPDHFFDGIFMWSHHEKFVIIDQSMAFVGGIDLCYGRWDDDMHRLVDLGKKENLTTIPEPKKESVSIPHSQSEMAIDVNNNFKYINKFQHSQQQLSSIIKQNNLKQQKQSNDNDLKLIKAFTSTNMRTNDLITSPDITVNKKKPSQNVKVNTSPTKTVKLIKSKINNKRATVLIKKPIVSFKNGSQFSRKKLSESSDHLSSLTSSKNDLNSNSMASLNTNSDAYKKPIKWVSNKKDMINNKKLNINSIFKVTNLMKKKTNLNDDIYDRWHSNKVNNSFIDIEEIELPKNTDAGYYYWIGKDYSNAYKEDFKDIHEYNKDQFDRNEVPRMPWRDQGLVMIGESARDLARHFIQRWNQCKNEQVPLLDSYPYLIPKCYSEKFTYNYKEWFKEDLYKCSIQVLRSADDWSAGISKTETSILNAYCDLIKNSKNYVYIENQFFVTTSDPDKDHIKNTIGLALIERIILAYKNKQKFRVYVFLPLLPGFDRINAIKAVQYYNLRSIKFGEYSIYRELQKAGIADPSEYITFHGMRNWSVLMGKLVQEIIYVHSKLMIVDDKYVICGSANINDRSLIGKRDSEVAVLITDEEFVDSVMNKNEYKSGKYAFTLRQKIFKLHLGVYFSNPSHMNVIDCVSDEFYHMFKTISHQNTLVYDEVFKCLPSDNILTFNDLKNYAKQTCLNKTDPNEGKNKMEKFVMGLVVDFPLNFLSHEKNFFPDLVTAEGIVPSEMWT